MAKRMSRNTLFWTALVALGVVALVTNFPAIANAITFRKPPAAG
jgi:hypothetical protein